MIPLNKPEMLGNELEYVKAAVRGGQYVGACEELLESVFGGRVLLTPSGTHALELAAMLIDSGTLEWGEQQVVMPTFTFSSTANAFLRSGMVPVFVDSRPDTFNIDEKQIVIGPRTRAVVPVHYAGVGCSMPGISRASKGTPVIEDNAHGIFGKINGQLLGAIGDMAALSFHSTKNFQCGEGGALIINNGDWRKAERIRDKGTDRSAMLRGERGKYEWTDLGSSFTMSEMSAAFLLGQLEGRDFAMVRRRQIYTRYRMGLADWMVKNGVRSQSFPANCESSYHIFPILMPDEGARDRMIAHLLTRNIGSAFHYIPLHLSPMGRSLGYLPGQFPAAESIASRLVRLPIYPNLTREQTDQVIQAVEEFK